MASHTTEQRAFIAKTFLNVKVPCMCTKTLTVYYSWHSFNCVKSLAPKLQENGLKGVAWSEPAIRNDKSSTHGGYSSKRRHFFNTTECIFNIFPQHGTCHGSFITYETYIRGHFFLQFIRPCFPEKSQRVNLLLFSGPHTWAYSSVHDAALTTKY